MYRRINGKTIISILLCLGILFMAVGYSMLSNNLEITAGASITTTWDVRITKIITKNISGSAYNIDEPNFTNDTARFSLALTDPGDSITYTITIENKGTLAAILNSLDITTNGTSQIIYEVTGIKEGDILTAGNSVEVTVVARYNSNATEAPEDAGKSLEFGLNWIQYANQSINAGTYTINYNANGGTGSMSGTTCTVGSNCTLRSNAFTYSGYVFKGWNRETTGAHVYTDGQSVKNLTSSGKTVTLYAIWEKETLANIILRDNIAYADNVSSPYVTSSTGINFSNISSDTNGKGLYYTSTNTEGNQPTYYFRGAVTNNYVQFGQDSSGNDLYWKIIRINEDGSIRIIYNGTSTTATGSYVAIGYEAFNTDFSGNNYVGYMHGPYNAYILSFPKCINYESAADTWDYTGTQTSCSGIGGTWATSAYEGTHANEKDSAIKTVIDSWYISNLSSYSSYLADAGFCNDRSISSGLGYGLKTTYYGAVNRLYDNKAPQFACPNASNDLFTTSISTKGNKALTYPIGLITADEIAYAGGVAYSDNKNYYLYTGQRYWTISPADGVYFANFSTFDAYMFAVEQTGKLSYNSSYVHYSYGVRPVINLKSTVTLSSTNPSRCSSQNGSSSCPYVISTN